MTGVSENPPRAAEGAESPPRWPIISADDHLIEPPDLFEGRMPLGLVDRAPRIVEDADGTQAWEYEDGRYPNIGLNAVVQVAALALALLLVDGAGALRRDAPGLLGHRRPRRGHGRRRGLGVVVLPVADRRIRRDGLRPF